MAETYKKPKSFVKIDNAVKKKWVHPHPHHHYSVIGAVLKIIIKVPIIVIIINIIATNVINTTTTENDKRY